MSPVQSNKSSNAIGDMTEKVMIGYKTWNSKGDVIAFCRLYTEPKNSMEPGLRLFLANPELQQVVGPLNISADGLPLNASLCSPVRWLNDRQLLCSVATYANKAFPEKSMSLTAQKCKSIIHMRKKKSEHIKT